MIETRGALGNADSPRPGAGAQAPDREPTHKPSRWDPFPTPHQAGPRGDGAPPAALWQGVALLLADQYRQLDTAQMSSALRSRKITDCTRAGMAGVVVSKL